MPKPSSTPPPHRNLPPVRRVVVKIGSAVLAPGGMLEQSAVERLSADIANVASAGVQVTVVSSGAVASGFRALGLSAPPKTIVQKQAAAAVGQQRLMAAWAHAMTLHDRAVAQVLYTGDDLDDRARFLNARRTLEELLARGVIPIVNENDTVSFEEIKLGDNDRLSALTADLVGADLLLILSSVSGVYESGKSGHIMPTIADAKAAMKHVRTDKSSVGTGGMGTKITAAAAASSWGIPTIVAGGHELHIIQRVLAGEPLGTLFEPAKSGAGRKAPSRKRWLAFSAKPRGTIIVDDGAAKALTQRHASLLPSGVTGVEGDFERDSAVEIATSKGEVIARGLCTYASTEIEQISGKKSTQISAVLGYVYAEEIVHRNDLVIL